MLDVTGLNVCHLHDEAWARKDPSEAAGHYYWPIYTSAHPMMGAVIVNTGIKGYNGYDGCVG